MKYLLWVCSLVILVSVACTSKKGGKAVQLKNGVSLELAKYRKAILSQVHYDLDMDIPKDPTEPITASETIRFNWNDSLDAPLQIDYLPRQSAIHKMSVNGEPTVPNYQKEHLIVDGNQLKIGENEISFEFAVGEAALNRKKDYLYSLFVPDRARTAFPCFDQPDLKATFKLSLSIADSWQALSNARLESTVLENGKKTLQFANSDTISTYLFAFAAGDFKKSTVKVDTSEIALLYRETDSVKIKASLKKIFSLSQKAISYLEQWTGIHYPFQEKGMVAIPNFQFGGMEHPGSIFYQSSSLFLDPEATQGQLNSRSNLIAHELSHMWFGDLVTMKWFNDVWMKEVFANFMADKITRPRGGDEGADLKFLIEHYPGAFSEDRTPGSNPIRQPLDNLNNAGMLYGNIIYDKAPIMMRQLEQLMGKSAFQKGVRAYLKKYANGNASWPDLINILNQNSSMDLKKWNEVWVNQSGRPLFRYDLQIKNGLISRLTLHQQPELKDNAGRQDKTSEDNNGTDTAKTARKIWPQVFDVDFYYTNSVKHLGVRNASSDMDIKAAKGLPKPLFILWNASGKGYGIWPTDTVLIKNLHRIKPAVSRASAYINLYENMLNGSQVSPEKLLQVYQKALSKEQTELNIKLLTGYLPTIYWEFIKPEQRKKLNQNLEDGLWKQIGQHRQGNIKKLILNAYIKIFTGKPAQERLKTIWDKQLPPEGVHFYEQDYADLALALALRMPDNHAFLDSALNRISNPDRKSRFRVAMQAADADPAIRSKFFKSLSTPEGRSNESAVIQALYLLNHPLHQPESEQYLKSSLRQLAEIQRSSSIFFPKSWLLATFSYYQSATANDIVQSFLQKNADLNPKLKGKVLQATDNLRRSQHL